MTVSRPPKQMSSSEQAPLSNTARHQVYILRHLAQKGACLLWRKSEASAQSSTNPHLTESAIKTSISKNTITLVKSRNAVSLAAGTLTHAQFVALQSRDFITLAAPDGNTQSQATLRRYVLSSAGEAFLARIDADIKDHAFLVQHQTLARQSQPSSAPTQKTEAILVNQKESPLAWLARRRDGKGKALLSSAQFLAGERLRQDLTFAQMLPSVTSNWSGVGAGRGQNGQMMTYSDKAIAARQRVNRALTAVGQEFSGILLDVCGFLKGLELIEREHGWPQRSAKLVLGMALSRLARHYGFAEETQGKSRAAKGGLVHWGSEDYRPLLDGMSD